VEGADRLFSFVQFEFPWALGPDDGRYVVRPAGTGESPSHILVLQTLGARERRRLRRGKPRTAEPEPAPASVATTRATVITVGPPSGSEEALREWFGAESHGETVDAALRVLNGALRHHRAAAADPGIHEVTADNALVLRVGYGRGEQVAEGRWAEAVEVPATPAGRQRRTAALRPQERLAALLGGREDPLACEELVLRARTDLDAGRSREAALQLRVALEAALAELEGRPDLAERIGELREQRGAVGDAANAALRGPLSPAALEHAEHAVERLEALLRARTAARA